MRATALVILSLFSCLGLVTCDHLRPADATARSRISCWRDMLVSF
jgi:hypothetical protein